MNRLNKHRVSGVFALSVIMELLVSAEENEVVKIMEKIASTFSPAGRVPYLLECLYQGLPTVKFFQGMDQGVLKIALIRLYTGMCP
jgi:hypothetical protein